MESVLPIKSILRHSIIFATAVSVMTFMSSFLNNEGLGLTVYRAASTFIIVYGFCIINLRLLKKINKGKSAKKCKRNLSGKNPYIIGVLCTVPYFFILHFITVYLAQNGYIPLEAMRIEVAKAGFWIYFFLLFASILLYTMVYFLHNFITLQNLKVNVDLENSRLRSIHAETVNQLLKQQIQPHFLFNALNILKSLIKKQPDLAEEYLISLSDFLRASVNQNKKTVSCLKDELKICIDYMEMQKIRFGEAVNFNISDIKNADKLFLPAFSLQPLVENAIKHNGFTNAIPLTISIFEKDHWVYVKNNLQPKKNVQESTGNGLSNLTERYRLLSGDPIQIEETEESFIVKLKVLEEEQN